jgi:hypothetical protein
MKVAEDIGITFLGGVYPRIRIPAVALDGRANGGHVRFYGILERTDEEMAERRPEVQKRGPLPYYEAPYVSASALPDARRRYEPENIKIAPRPRHIMRRK